MDPEELNQDDPRALAALLQSQPTLTHQIVPPMMPGTSAPAVMPRPETLEDIMSPTPTVSNPGPRTQWHAIYDNPKRIAEDAAANTEPESPNLQFYFDTNREKLADIANRKLDPEATSMMWNPKAKARGAATSSLVMTPANEQRIGDTLDELRKGAPDLYTGMKGWYVMDPAYHQLVQTWGPEEGGRMYQALNSMSFFSPESAVPTEINRGTAGLMMYNQGRMNEFSDAGLRGEYMAKLGYPLVKGNKNNRNASRNMDEFLQGGMTPEAMQATMRSGDPKVALYYQASLPPELGGQTTWPVPDAHFVRGLGFGDVRPWAPKRSVDKNGNVKFSAPQPNGEATKSPEYTPIGPWFRKIAEQQGLQAVPAQAIQWGGLAHITGVKTKVGAPKLELFADRIDQIAKQLGITKDADRLKFRDAVLAGKHHAALDVLNPDMYG